MAQSINKIHLNNSTRISLNDRFTVIQSISPPVNNNQTSTLNNKSHPNGGNRRRPNQSGGVSLANKKFLEQLEKKHKMRTALKLKRRSLKATMPPTFRRGVQGQINGFRSGRIRGGGINGRFRRSNNFANNATMKADLLSSPVSRRLNRSNSVSNLVGRLGTVRQNTATSRRLKIRRGSQNNTQQIRGRSRSRQRLTQSNTNTQLTRSNSRTNLQRSNSRSNLNLANARVNRARSISRNRQQQVRNAIKNSRGGRGQIRTTSVSRNNSRMNTSVHSRLGVKRMPMQSNKKNLRGNNKQVLTGGRRVVQGRIMKRKNSTVMANLNGTGARQGRIRGRGNANGNRSRSRGRNNVPVARRGAIGGGGGVQKARNRGRGGRGIGRGINRSSVGKKDVKKEDLDQELDQYMAATKSSDF